MKPIRSVITKAACMLALTSVATSFSFSQSQVKPHYTQVTAATGDIRFVCVEGDMLVFELKMQSLLPKGSMIRVVDGDYNVLYEERTRTETYNIRYKIVINEINKINFEISNRYFNLQQSFNVNAHTEEKVEVTKA